MDKRLLLLLCCLTMAGCASQANKTNPIECKPASEEVNRAAETAIRSFLSDYPTHGVPQAWLPEVVTCGPHLWAKIEANPALANLGLGAVLIHSATIGPDGRMQVVQTQAESKNFRDEDQVQPFWKAVLDMANVSGGYAVRKSAPDELKILSSQVPFALSEPIFVVECRESHLIMVMCEEEGQYRPLWVDDVYGVGR